MAWSMQASHRYDEAQSRWHHPPPVLRVHVDAPTATALLDARRSTASMEHDVQVGPPR